MPTWSLTETESTKLYTYWTKFEEYVAPKSNFRLARYKLRILKQDKGESVDCFIKKVRILVKECKYTNVDEHVIDALIFGSSDPRIQAKLLEHDASLTLTEAIDIARTAEAATSQLADIRNPEPLSRQIHALTNSGNNSKYQIHSKICGHPVDLTPSRTNITAFGGHVIEQYGTCLLKFSHNGIGNKYPFHVVSTSGPTILGLPTCGDMQLVTLNCSITNQPVSKQAVNDSFQSDPKEALLHEYADCFSGIGCFEGEFHITLDPAVSPIIRPPHRVPEAVQELVKKELDSLEAQGIITKVSEPTDWVKSLVCVTKLNGSLRLCLDPKDLNKAIKRPHHHTPTIDEILPKL